MQKRYVILTFSSQIALKVMISAVFAKCKIASINFCDQGVRICTKYCYFKILSNKT